MIEGSHSIKRLLAAMAQLDASDLHIKVGLPPVYRVGGHLKRVNTDPLNEDEADHMLDPLLDEAQRARFLEHGSLDFAAHLDTGDRFRVNMYLAGGHVHAAIRRVKAEIPTYASLHLPSVYSKIVDPMRSAVRQDPDVIFIGEMRDKNTMLAAIQAAETGHLVFATLHTADTMQSFGRILEFFPPEERQFIRMSLSNSLRAICAQRLLPALDDFQSSTVPATEVLLMNPSVREVHGLARRTGRDGSCQQNNRDGSRPQPRGAREQTQGR